MTAKVLLATVALVAGASVCTAQDIYNEVRAKAVASVENPSTIVTLREIAQFEVDALDYMMIKMREQMPDTSAVLLDRQAVALREFVNLFMQSIVESADKADSDKANMMKAFMDASYSNPMFNDTDTELTLTYFSNASCLTRFSLDTDWRKAVTAIEAMCSQRQ